MQTMTRGCWIVVVDGDGAMIVENAGTLTAPDMRLIDRIETPRSDVLPTPPRMQALRGAEERTDREKLAQTAMVAMLVSRLAFATRQARIPRVAIAAPPDLLAAIRARLDKDLSQRVVLMLPRSLTDLPLEKIVVTMNGAMDRAA